MVLRGLINFPSAPPGGASSSGDARDREYTTSVRLRRGWPLPQTAAPRYGRPRGSVHVRRACLRASPVRCSRRRCHPGAQGPVAESRGRKGHGCQRPSCGHGSGPTGNCMPEMPDCDQPRRASRLPCSIESGIAGPSALDRRGCVCFRFRSIHPGAMGCAHAENAPCSNSSCQSKKAKAALSIPRQRSRD